MRPGKALYDFPPLSLLIAGQWKEEMAGWPRKQLKSWKKYGKTIHNNVIRNISSATKRDKAVKTCKLKLKLVFITV